MQNNNSEINLVGVVHEPEMAIICETVGLNDKRKEFIIKCNSYYYLAALGLMEFVEKNLNPSHGKTLN